MATDASPPSEVAEFAGQLLFRLWRATHTRTAEAFESLDLTPALFALLNVLGAREGAMQQEIGAEMGIDRSTMVVLIDELEAKHLAERRPHPTDRRARAVAITANGRQVLQRARDLALQVEGEVLRGLKTDERDELVALLRRALSSAPPQSPWRAEEGD
jgi:MarR family transcriptional regulator for hemolysin